MLSAGVCALAVACGNEEPDESACALLARQDVAAALRSAGVEPPPLQRSRSESLDQSVCSYRGRGHQRAAQHRQRAGGQAQVLQPRHRGAPVQRPRSRRPARSRSRDSATRTLSGPAGAYWVADFRQLFVLRGERLFIYQVSAPGLAAERRGGAAVRLARDDPSRRARGAASAPAAEAAPPELARAGARGGRGRAIRPGRGARHRHRRRRDRPDRWAPARRSATARSPARCRYSGDATGFGSRRPPAGSRCRGR